MLLTPGSLLQQDRYWVEAVLQEDDMTVSYRALHRNLDKHVVIQTLGRKLHQHPKADQLRHDFLIQVRQQTQQQDSIFRVIDCFVEGNSPFVVMDLEDDQPLPEMGQWIPNLSAILEGEPQAIADAATTPDSPTTVESPVPSIGEPERHSDASLSDSEAHFSNSYQTQPPTSATAEPTSATTEPTSATTESTSATTESTLPMAEVTAAVVGKGMSTNGYGTTPSTSTSTSPAKPYARVQSTKPPSRKPSKRSLWIPASLLLTAIVGGCGGAYLGWQVRQGHSFADVVPVVGPRINTEQDFPPLDDWPNQADSDVFEKEFDRPTRAEAARDGISRARPTADSPSEEDISIEPYGIDYIPGETTLPFEDESSFPTQETRSIPDAPGSNASESLWEEDSYTPDAEPSAPVEPVPLPSSETFNTVPAEEEPKDKLETFPDLPQTPQSEERSFPVEPEPAPQSISPAFPEDFITPQ